jgi:hypothetical protein
MGIYRDLYLTTDAHVVRNSHMHAGIPGKKDGTIGCQMITTLFMMVSSYAKPALKQRETK